MMLLPILNSMVSPDYHAGLFLTCVLIFKFHKMKNWLHLLSVFICIVYFTMDGYSQMGGLGSEEAIRVYVEFADGTNRGMMDPVTGNKGLPDEDYDATTAMVINWHKMKEKHPDQNARLEFRKEYPDTSLWIEAEGESYEFWHREELIHRVILKDLTPNSVYSFRVKKEGETFRFRTMPESLTDRPVKIVITSDHQSPKWNEYAHANAKMTALLQPDMFIVIGDFVNCAGQSTDRNAESWAKYLDQLYGIDAGYFLYDRKLGGDLYRNLIIPHVSILGNHETGDGNHIRWPSCVATGKSEPGYPMYTAANWMELLFHFPFKSEGFYSEYRPDHPNINQEYVREGFGQGGFGKLSFADYLLLIALDNGSQNWEGEPDQGLRDWEGKPITEKWPWFETHHSDVRQDVWLANLLEPEEGPTAGSKYENIIPLWHRGLFGSARINMSLKNRGIFEYWLPVLERNGVKFIGEAHDHLYSRSVPMKTSQTRPENTYLKKVYYEPLSWELTSDLESSYLDRFYSVNCLFDETDDTIVGWEYKGRYITYDPQGFRTFGYGGWAAGRRQIGDRGAGNAGWWFVDPEKGGDHFSGEDSYHINVLTLTPDGFQSEAFDFRSLDQFQKNEKPVPIHSISWDNESNRWSDQP